MAAAFFREQIQISLYGSASGSDEIDQARQLSHKLSDFGQLHRKMQHAFGSELCGYLEEFTGNQELCGYSFMA